MYTFTPRPALLHPHRADDRCIINNSLSVYSSWLCGGGGDGRPLKQGKNMPLHTKCMYIEILNLPRDIVSRAVARPGNVFK